jgi:hypothetical protein
MAVSVHPVETYQTLRIWRKTRGTAEETRRLLNAWSTAMQTAPAPRAER